MNNSTFKKLVTFVLLLVLIFISLHLLYKESIPPQNTHLLKLNTLETLQPPPSVILFGNSRVAFGLKNRYLSKNIYNFAYPGENFNQIYLKVRWARRNVDNFKVAIIPFDRWALSTGKAKVKDVGQVLHFSSYSELRSVYGLSYPEIIKATLKFHANRGYTLLRVLTRDLVFRLLDKEPQKNWTFDQYNDLAHSSGEKKWTNHPREVRLRKAKSNAKEVYETNLSSSYMESLWKQLKSYCEKHNIKIILIRNPLAQEWQRFMNKYQFQTVNKIYREADVFHKFDYTTTFDTRQMYFRNPHHINSYGSEVLTKKFRKDLRKLFEQPGISIEVKPSTQNVRIKN